MPQSHFIPPHKTTFFLLLNFIIKKKEIKSKSKYYVAVTRARYSVAFVFDEIFENEYFKKESIKIGNESISVSKYIE